MAIKCGRPTLATLHVSCSFLAFQCRIVWKHMLAVSIYEQIGKLCINAIYANILLRRLVLNIRMRTVVRHLHRYSSEVTMSEFRIRDQFYCQHCITSRF